MPSKSTSPEPEKKNMKENEKKFFGCQICEKDLHKLRGNKKLCYICRKVNIIVCDDCCEKLTHFRCWSCSGTPQLEKEETGTCYMCRETLMIADIHQAHCTHCLEYMEICSGCDATFEEVSCKTCGEPNVERSRV
jgi:hypothetical protein